MYKVSAEEIEEKLKVRVRDLEMYAVEYCEMLAKEVDIVGSRRDEYFEVERNNDGSVQVSMYDTAGSGKKGEDIFRVSAEENKSIRARIVGGRGADRYDYDRTAFKYNTYKAIPGVVRDFWKNSSFAVKGAL